MLAVMKQHMAALTRAHADQQAEFAATGASYSFRNKELAVVGGGDTAVEEAMYLTKYASKVSLLCGSSDWICFDDDA